MTTSSAPLLSYLQLKRTAFLVTSIPYLYAMRTPIGTFDFLLVLPIACGLLYSVTKNEFGEAKRALLVFCAMFVSLVLLSFLFHYLALGTLHQTELVSIDGQTAGFAQRRSWNLTQLYVFFPLLVLASAWFFTGNSQRLKQLLVLPIIFLPSALVGIYQALGHMDFLNPSKGTYPSGLSFDPSAFGMSLFILIPMGFIGTIASARAKNRFVFIGTSVLLTLALLLRMQRTALSGLLIIFCCLPMLYYGCKLKPDKRALRRYILLYIFAVVFIAATISLSSGLRAKAEGLLTVVKTQIFSTDAAGQKHLFENAPLFHDRLIYAIPAMKLIHESPIAGWGPAGFYRHFNNIRYLEGKTSYVPDNTGNYYLQLWTELGLPGLLLGILFHLAPVCAALAAMRRIIEFRERLAVALLSATVFVLMFLYMTGPHILAPDVAFLTSVPLGYLLAVGIEHGRINWSRYQRSALVCFLIMLPFFLWGTWRNSFGDQGYRSFVESESWPARGVYGRYQLENWGDKIVRWIMKESGHRVVAASDFMSFIVVSQDQNSTPPAGLKFQLFIDNKPIDEMTFFGSETRRPVYYLPSVTGKNIHVTTKVSRTFNPAGLGISSDNRELAVAMSDDIFLPQLPPEGIGFYPQETWTGGVPEDLAGVQPLVFHWTSMRASQLLPESARTHGLNLALMMSHPDIKTNAVRLRVLLDAKPLREEVFSDNAWRRLFLPAEDLRGGSILTFIVSRTWNPRSMEVSEDRRDLGVAVSIQP